MAYQPEIEKLERRYQDEPAKNFAQLAEAYRRGGRVDEALDLLQMHLEDRPNYVSALIVLGRCHLDKAQDAEAAQAFERVLSIDAENIIALKVLGEIAQRAGDPAAARTWLTRLLEVDPMNEEAEAALATLDEAPAGPAPEADAMAAAEPAGAVEPGPPASPAPAAGPTEEIVIERASTEYEAPAVDLAGTPSDDLDLETSPEAELSVPEEEPAPEDIPAVSRESSAIELVEEDLEDAADEPSEAGPAPSPDWDADVTAPLPPVDRAVGEAARSPEAEREAPDAPPAEAERETDEEAEVEEPPAVRAAEDAALEMQPFDTDLAWGTGERMSREISAEDLEAAEQSHEASLEEAAVQELPGLEHTEVPAPAAGHDVAPAEGLVAGDLTPDEETRPLEGLVPDGVPEGAEDAGDVEAPRGFEAAAGDAVTRELDAPTAEEVAAEPPDAAGDDAWAVEAGASAPGERELAERGSLAGLPVFLPEREEQAADAEEPGADVEEAEPEPVVTETMAELYARQGHLEEAKRVYRRLLEQRPDDPQLLQRLAELERRPPGPSAASAGDPRARYSAAASGGVSARDFLRAVLEGRATTVTPPEAPDAPSPMDEAFAAEPLEPRGAPTRPASDQPSLSSVFGEEPAPSPSTADQPAQPSKPDEGGFSFDEFFGERPETGPTDEPPEAETGRTPRLSVDDIDESDESFKAWLKGLKS